MKTNFRNEENPDEDKSEIRSHRWKQIPEIMIWKKMNCELNNLALITPSQYPVFKLYTKSDWHIYYLTLSILLLSQILNY